MLYQLSYFRIVSTTVHHFPDCECKGSPFFETTKIIDYLFLKKVTNFFSSNNKSTSTKNTNISISETSYQHYSIFYPLIIIKKALPLKKETGLSYHNIIITDINLQQLQSYQLPYMPFLMTLHFHHK